MLQAICFALWMKGDIQINYPCFSHPTFKRLIALDLSYISSLYLFIYLSIQPLCFNPDSLYFAFCYKVVVARTYQCSALSAHFDLPLKGSPCCAHRKLLPAMDPTLAIFKECIQLS